MKSIKLLKLLLVIVPVSVFGKVEDLNKVQTEAIEKIDITKMLKDYDQHLSNIIDGLTNKNSKEAIGYLIEYYCLANRNCCKKAIEKINGVFKDVSVNLLEDYLILFCDKYDFNTISFHLDKDAVQQYNEQFLWAIDFLKNKVLYTKFHYRKQHAIALKSLIKQYNDIF